MTPNRVLPYVLIFLALISSYFVLQWTEARRESKEIEAKKVFTVKEADIGELALIKGKEEIRLVKKDKDWTISKPLPVRADQEAVGSMVTTLAHLSKERSLGPQEDLKVFGLDKPDFVVEFTAQGKPHRLAMGSKVPGDRAYYAFRDQDKGLFLISSGDKESLDRQLWALRDKTLFAFAQDKVKALTVKAANQQVTLERVGPQAWRLVGRESSPVRGDRIEALLRQLHAARVKDFAAEAPHDLKPFGLAPKPAMEVQVVLDQGQEALMLGAKAPNGVYGRKRSQGPVIVVDPGLPGQITKTLASLEDRRLWSGPVVEVQKVVWGPPGKTWSALKEKDFWKITGPEARELRQPGVRLDMGLWKLTQLEYERILPGVSPHSKGPEFLLEVYDAAGKLFFRLEDMGKRGDSGVEVRTQAGEKAQVALISRKDYIAWQGEMERLTKPLQKKD